MTEILLTSEAEKRAEKAESLKAFSGLKLLHVKKQVAKILALIGRDGIFDEYTKHDISHLDYMLESLDWIIPDGTKDKLTSSDWMMIVLSIYFHDLGMLVTKDEYKERYSNEIFNQYKSDVLEGKFGAEFKDKISKIVGDDQDRFLYQEYVRRTHAERIKYWIIGEKPNYQKIDLTVVEEIQKLVATVLMKFKRDLAMVCESHHLSDLDNFEKYKVNQPYGTSADEVVNVHYAALILRTADLMHITSDRTPSIEFQLINPSDPKSQEEWCKQKAVLQVRPLTKKNKEGNFDESIPKDTFEIIASFEDENGFFGLIAYLNYAVGELERNYAFNQQAQKKYASQFQYPWRNIDDSSIEAINFIKKQFEFILDQPKILDLLVGHTLYNDSTVVLRELTQNAIDAVKLQKYAYELEGKTHSYIPEVKIIWDDSKRILSFLDNGTGMTLEIIENHLLKVGSSRYQDENFKKKYPDFSPISRFGIGLLTCFLIANDIDIITKSNDSDKAIILRIKKVHGKYLLKYLTSDEVNPILKGHGTEVKLYVRSDVNLDGIENDLKKWILLPNSKLSLSHNGKEINIGYSKPSEILTEYLKQIGYDVDQKNLRVEEFSQDGVTMAFALRYIEHFKEWKFLEYRDSDKEIIPPIGTCIEGIRVDFNTPGFLGMHLYSLVNTTGKKAPKTNVARSTIEVTPEKENLLNNTYQLYLNHISNELKNLHTKNGFSLSWATYEANYLLQSFLKEDNNFGERTQVMIEDPVIFEKAISNIKCLLFEQKGKRIVLSINEIRKLDNFWTIDCALYNSADSLIKEIPSSDASALSLLKTLISNNESQTDHIDNLFCNFRTGNVIERIISNNFQVNAIKIIPNQRRLDLRWVSTKQKIWEQIEIESDYRNDKSKCFIQLEDIELENAVNQIAIKSANELFILKNSEMNKYLVELLSKLSSRSVEDKLILSKVVGLLNSFFYYKDLDKTKIEELIEHRFERSNLRDIGKIIWGKVNKEDLITTISKTSFIKYDTTIWYSRRGW